MQKQLSVMNNLHQIGDRLSPQKKDGLNDAGENDLASVNDPADPEARQKPAATKEQIARSAKLEEALIRRMEDHLRVKDDLAARLIQAIAAIREEENFLKSRLAGLEPDWKELTEIEQKIRDFPPPPSAESPDFQTLLADQCLELERLRLEAFRIISARETSSALAGKRQAPDSAPFNPEALTFRQMFRCGCSILLPVMLVLIAGAVLIAFAVVAAFNGAIHLW